jgi:transcription initiation factor TFIID TATA-box-binding protein
MHVETSSIKLKIVNISLNFNLGKRLDLDTLQFGRYDGKKFNALVYKLSEPKSTALIFGSGKVTLLGCKNQQEIISAIYAVCNKVNCTKPKELVINNFVGVYHCGHKINLEILRSLLSNSYFEPEIFSGLVYRSPKTSFSAMFFRTGKVILTGSKSIEELNKHLFEFRSLINKVKI